MQEHRPQIFFVICKFLYVWWPNHTRLPEQSNGVGGCLICFGFDILLIMAMPQIFIDNQEETCQNYFAVFAR